VDSLDLIPQPNLERLGALPDELYEPLSLFDQGTTQAPRTRLAEQDRRPNNSLLMRVHETGGWVDKKSDREAVARDPARKDN